MPTTDGPRIVVFGDVIDDIVVIPNGPIRTDTDTPSAIRNRAGGSAANVATWLGSLGAPVDFVGVVGSADVERHSALLASAGVASHLIGDRELPTGTIVLIVEGERRTMLTSTGANAAMTPDAVSDELLDAASHLHFTGYSLFGRADDEPILRLIDRAASRGVQVSVDPGSAGFLVDFGVDRFLRAVRGASLVFPNLEEGRVLTGLHDPEDVAEGLLEHFRLAAVTLDTDGIVLARRGHPVIRIESIAAEIVDPTGAGDAFAAGFLANWVCTRDDVAAARAGVASGARAVATIGGRPA
ncbi:PfkB family carbohydrate kinase [Glaciihabitans sp. UYNi722]|uniref:carbohydrate kinase family protein n=1 Tax=Glaciihabitans sp. UYNi722 TaxID=3156344 RepID=UPI0033946851